MFQLLYLQTSFLDNTGLVGSWHFSEGSGTTTADMSGNGNNGTLVNGPTWTPSGKFGNALSFDGVDDYVTLCSDTSLDNIPVKSIEFWTKLNAQTSSGTGSHWVNKGDTGWFISTNPVNNRNIFAHNFNVTIGRWSFPQISLDIWHHVVVVYDRRSSANDPLIYVNGVAQPVTRYSTPSGTANDDSSFDLLISKSPGYDGWVNGFMDEVLIYNRALTEAEIQTRYNFGSLGNSNIKGDYVNLEIAREFYNLGISTFKEKQYEKARDFFIKAVSCFNIFPEAYHKLAETYTTLKEEELAYENYQKCMGIINSLESPSEEMVKLSEDVFRKSEKFRALENKIADLNNDLIGNIMELGNQSITEEDYLLAEEIFTLILKIDNNIDEASKSLKKVNEELKKALQPGSTPPNDEFATLLYQAGLALIKDNKFLEATKNSIRHFIFVKIFLMPYSI